MSDGLKKAHERVERIRKKGSEGLARFTAIRFMLWFHGEVQAISKELQAAKEQLAIMDAAANNRARKFRDMRAAHGECPDCKRVLDSEDELQSAKAENGRLVEAVNIANMAIRALMPESGPMNRQCRKALDEIEALSTSNALDYWQGEIRKAKAEGMDRALSNLPHLRSEGDSDTQWISKVKKVCSEASSRINPQCQGERE